MGGGSRMDEFLFVSLQANCHILTNFVCGYCLYEGYPCYYNF